MTSGRKLTEQDRWTILRIHAETAATKTEIAYELAMDYRTVSHVIDEAARGYYRLAKPNHLDELSDLH